MTIEASLREQEVLTLELQPPLVLESTVSVADVILAMRRHSLGYALLETAGRLTGIFTERDVLLSVLGNQRILGESIARHMTADPARVNGSDPVWRVVEMMHAGGYRQVPVVDTEGRVLGCVRHKDIAGYLVNHYAAQVLNLPPDPELVASAPEGG